MTHRATIVEALREAIREEMVRDERVYCMGEDIDLPGGFGGAFTVTLGLLNEFGPTRVVNTPISENGFAGMAVGAALAGMRPIIDVQYGDFLFCMMEQIVNEAAKLTYMSGGKVRVPLVLRAPVGATGRSAQHAQSLEAYFVHVPGLKICVPSNAFDAKGLLKTAVRDDNPVLFFEHKLLYGAGGHRAGQSGAVPSSSDIPDEEYLIPFGRAAIRREGADVTIIAKLLMVYRALEAAEALAKDGIDCEVIDPRTLVPFDEETLLASVQKTHRLVVVEEENRRAGWGAEIAALVQEKAFDHLDGPIIRVAAPDTPVPFAPTLEQFWIPNEREIIESVRVAVSQ